MILMGPFQLGIFYDSMILLLKLLKSLILLYWEKERHLTSMRRSCVPVGLFVPVTLKQVS